MIERSQLEKLLKVNGVESSAPDDEIKSVLLSARWHQNDVETALLVLRENKVNHQTHVDSLHRVFRSDDKLRPETMLALLGIDVDVPTNSVVHKSGMKRYVSTGQILQISAVAVCFSLLFVLGSMWLLQMGIFHPTVR